MNKIKLPIPKKKLEIAKKNIILSQEKYNKILNGIHDMKITENTMVTCKKCGKKSKIKNVDFSRFYWYEKPRGCMDGDCWHLNGFIVFCPNCGECERFSEPQDNDDLRKLEFRILSELLYFAQQIGDVRFSNDEFKISDTIEFKYS